MSSCVLKLRAGMRVGGFTISGFLPAGQGGMAVVVRAARIGQRHTYTALKISRIGEDAVGCNAAIHREVEMLQQLSHPGIITLQPVLPGTGYFKAKAVDLAGSPWYLAMELMEGGTLEAYLHRVRRVSVPEGVFLALSVCDALIYLHEHGLVHNDLKPANIMFRTSPAAGMRFEPVLVDFGIAGRSSSLQPDGSPPYMAPERFPPAVEESSHTAIWEIAPGGKSDVWSMGILLYRMLSGKEPFFHLQERKLIDAIRTRQPGPLRPACRGIPPLLEQLILDGCLAKDPVFRVSVDELYAVLSAFRHSGIVHTGIGSGFMAWARNGFSAV